MVASRSSPIHHSSLVDPATHSPALLELIDVKITKPVIDYVVDCVIECVDYALGRPTTSTPGRSTMRRPEHAKFATFATNVITRAEITTPTLLATLVYIDRAKPHLHIALEEWALERVFLGALIVASKYLNDSTLKNIHWALCTGVFGKRDIGRIEREYLDVLDFELGVTEDDILSHHHGLMSVTLGLQRKRSVSPHSSNIEQVPSSTAHVRNHRRRRMAVPELEPSSPESASTSSSASPQTPSATSTSPSHQKAALFAPPGQPKKPLPDTTMDLLRSFPFPAHQPPGVRQAQFPIHI